MTEKEHWEREKVPEMVFKYWLSLVIILGVGPIIRSAHHETASDRGVVGARADLKNGRANRIRNAYPFRKSEVCSVATLK